MNGNYSLATLALGREKPPHSYIGLIAMAILSSPTRQRTLSQIYEWIAQQFPYFQWRTSGWRNSIRHNLSLNDCFVKMNRAANGKGHYWAIHPANLVDFSRGDFRRKQAQWRVRAHATILSQTLPTANPKALADGLSQHGWFLETTPIVPTSFGNNRNDATSKCRDAPSDARPMNPHNSDKKGVAFTPSGTADLGRVPKMAIILDCSMDGTRDQPECRGEEKTRVRIGPATPPHIFRNGSSSSAHYDEDAVENGEPMHKLNGENGHATTSSQQWRTKRPSSPSVELQPQQYNGSWAGWSVMPRGRRCGSGLYNTGNYCFLNSILQMVVHTPHLARMLVETQDVRICRKLHLSGCFHCTLRAHIIRAVQSNTPFTANAVRQHLPVVFRSHRHGSQEDAHEMLTLLLDALDPQLPPKENDKLVAEKEPRTPIQEIFGGRLKNEVSCTQCRLVHTNYEQILELNLGLPSYGYPRVEVCQLLDAFFRPETIDSFQCSRCKVRVKAIRRTTLLRAPSVLIIQIKRFNLWGSKNRLPVTANTLLSLGKFAYKKPDNDKLLDCEYRLNGVVQHIGGGLNFGHYVCAMRGFDHTSWYRFDDSEVAQITGNDVQRMEPYILVYTKQTEPAKQDTAKATMMRKNIFSFSPCDPLQPPQAKRPMMPYLPPLNSI